MFSCHSGSGFVSEIGDFLFLLTEMNFRMCKGSVKCHHFSLSNGTCEIEGQRFILQLLVTAKVPVLEPLKLTVIFHHDSI